MMQRVLEPEVMDSPQEASEYDAMDFTEVNTAFAQQAIACCPSAGIILDAGTGTARIPILICQQSPQWQIIGIDLAQSMLKIGLKNVEQAGLEKQIVLQRVDAKHLPYQHGYFDGVISNSLIHHLPEPLLFLQELRQVLKPNGGIFIRDLIRPTDEAALNILVESVSAECNEHQKMLFRNSLLAAFTLNEVRELMQQSKLNDVKVYQSSDRHWTAERAWKSC